MCSSETLCGSFDLKIPSNQNTCTHTQTTRVVENELEMLIRVELLVVAILIKVFVGLASEVRDFKKQRTPPGQHICRVCIDPLLCCMLRCWWNCYYEQILFLSLFFFWLHVFVYTFVHAHIFNCYKFHLLVWRSVNTGWVTTFGEGCRVRAAPFLLCTPLVFGNMGSVLCKWSYVKSEMYFSEDVLLLKISKLYLSKHQGHQ